MISFVRGTVVRRMPNAAIIDVGGFGMSVFATPTTLAELRTGEEVTLHTSFIVKEDSMSLYGFATEDEVATFDILLSVSGIGAKIALAILAVHTPDSLRNAVASQSVAALTQVPGVGKKGAQRMILELGSKLGPATGPTDIGEGGSSSAVVEALVGLGWNEDAASSAVREVETESGQLAQTQMLREALKKLGRK